MTTQAKPKAKAKAKATLKLRYRAAIAPAARDKNTSLPAAVEVCCPNFEQEVARSAVKEIKKAGALVKEQIVHVRFPRLQLHEAWSIFHVDFVEADGTSEYVDTQLAYLSEYYGEPLATLQAEFREELSPAIAQAKDAGLKGNIAVWDRILTSFRNQGLALSILRPVEDWFMLQCSNGQLERNFLALRQQEERCRGNWGADSMDERLRIRLAHDGPSLDPTKNCVEIDPVSTMEIRRPRNKYHDAIVDATHQVTPKNKSSPKKRQQSLAELCLNDGVPQRKRRDDKGGKHPTYGAAASSSHTDSLDYTSTGHAILDAEEQPAERKVVLVDVDAIEDPSQDPANW